MREFLGGPGVRTLHCQSSIRVQLLVGELRYLQPVQHGRKKKKREILDEYLEENLPLKTHLV